MDLIKKITSIDLAAMLWIRKIQSRPLTIVMKFFTVSGAGRTWIVIAILLMLFQKLGIHLVPMQAEFLRGMLCALTAWFLGSFIKRAVNRRRPSEKIENYEPLISAPNCRSFPSSHTSSSVAFATALFLLNHELAAFVAIWAVIVTFSRFYLGVHFLSDLAGGAVLGIFCGFGINPISELFRMLA